MTLKIRPLIVTSEKIKYLNKIIHDNYAHFYEVYERDSNLTLAFFTLLYLDNEIALKYVYVMPGHRKQGILNKIIKYARHIYAKNFHVKYLTICHEENNNVAQKICASKFKYAGFETTNRLHWYIIKQRGHM